MPDIVIQKQNAPKSPKKAPEQKQAIEWQAPEYEFRKKSPDWFWALGVLTLAFAASAVILKSFLFASFILLAGFSLALYGARKPKTASFSIGPRGIRIENNIYDYENLKCFWLNYDPPLRKELLLESKKTFMPRITIMLGDENPEKIRDYLLKFIPEEKIEESLITTLARLLKI